MACCRPFHQGVPAPSAAALMRTRYSAYVHKLTDYLLDTWHPSTRPTGMDWETPPQPRWMDLEIKAHQVIGPDQASVEFVARYRLEQDTHQLHEISRFVRENGRWFYLDGTFPHATTQP